MKPTVSIILVNWNGLVHTTECLESLKRITYPNYKVIVVDNASQGDDVAILNSKYGNYITLLKSTENLGFGGGNNIGIRYVLKERKDDYVLLLNNDTVVKPDFLDELVRTAEFDRNTGIVGGKIVYYRDPEKVWYENGRLDLIRGNAYHIHSAKIRIGGCDIQKTSFITGCLMLIRREVFEKVGLLPEEYFLSVEDVDFCYRVMKAGYTMKVNPKTSISHKVSVAKGGEDTPSEVYYLTRNRLHFMLSTVRSLRYVIPFMIFFTLSRLVIVCRRFIEYKADYNKAMVNGIRDGLTDTMGIKIL